MRTFSNFAVSFTIISILSGCLTLFGFAMNTGGPAIMTLGWLVVGFFVTLVALGMAEVASSYPTAGACTTGRPSWLPSPAATRPSGAGSSAGST
jgi:amino acid transporter